LRNGTEGDDRTGRRHVLLRALLGAGAGLLVAVLAFVYLHISRQRFIEDVLTAHSGPLVFAVFGGFVLLGLQSLRWWTVMRPVLPGLGYVQAYKAMLVGFFFNALLPMRGGDLLRVQYLGRRTGVSRAKLLGTEVVDFTSDKWGWVAAFPVVCLLSLLLPQHELPPVWLFRALAGFACLVTASGTVLLFMASPRWRHHRDGRPRGPLWLANLRDGFSAASWKRLLVVETVLAPLPWLWETFVIVVASRALDLGLTPMQAFGALTAWNMGTLIPSPGNAGSFEASGTLALGWLGVAPEKALAFIFLYHLAQVLPGMMAAAGLLVAEGETFFGKRSVFRGLAEQPGNQLSS
jgi:glycosyltransferase 2 family protein